MKYKFLVFITLFSAGKAFAFSDTTTVPIYRVIFHDNIKTEQKNTDKLDGKEDGRLRVGSNEDINDQVSDALYRKTNELRNWIESNDRIATNNDKVRFLKYVENVLIYFRVDVRAKQINAVELPALLKTFEKILRARADSQSILSYIQDASYPVALINTKVFAEDAEEKKAANNIIYVKYAALNPDKILQTIAPYAKESFADSLIILASRRDPVQFYSYAQSTTSPAGKLIHRSNDPMVKAVADLSQTDNALFYFPFLDDILSGKKTKDGIKKYVGDGEKGYDSIGYFRLLTSTAIDYSLRAARKDTAIAYYGANGLLQTMKYRDSLHFVAAINALHDQSNLAVRMKAIQPLGPAELYYALILSEDFIYTSSYKHSFNRLLQIMGTKPRGDSLLLSVNFDHFKKFIKMAANYNKLDTFLKTMPAARAELIMNNFVANLDKTGNLEDAVDVADSYSSLANKGLQESMLRNVIANEEKAQAENNRKGIVIYGLLKTLFKSFDDNGTSDISSEIGIPSIYEVPNKYLQDEKGRIVQQVFWYGDEDGKNFYPQFKNSFSPKEWKITEKKEWMEAVSVKGNVYIFANRPLNNDANLDDSAQIHLAAYMESIGMKPAVTVHRGHSYWLPRTLDRMAGDAKIVVLGSCGGYQNLNKILEICPDAHIISTKEIGAGDINRPILNYMNQTLASGANLSWKAMWQSLDKVFSADQSKAVRDSWDDYIPPYKNLGAIFLKAYSKKMETE
jgi:hypothetical protein